MVTFGAEMRIR